MTVDAARLKSVFDPRTVAVVGASSNPAKLGFHVMKSLVTGGFEGRVVPVNPGGGTVLEREAASSLTRVEGPVDLAVVVVPAQRVPDVLRACVARGVGGVVLITAGFREIEDASGADLHAQAAAIVDAHGLPVIGPNTFGMVNPHRRLNASFTPEFSLLRPGGIALLSQSGGISHLLGFLAMRNPAGFSRIVGLGNRLNVDFSHMVDYLMDDPETRAVMLHLEGIDQPRRLMDALQRHGRRKPVVAFKAGSSSRGDLAARSHTGSMAGSHAVYRGALRQSGVTVVDSTEALLDTGRALAGCPGPRGAGVAVLSGQAGPGIAACDVCEAMGLDIVAFEAGTQRAIDRLLPPLALRTNPVDMGPAWYHLPATRGIIEAALEDRRVSGLLLLIMYASANAGMIEGLAEFLTAYRQQKPVIGCILAPPGVWDEPVRRLEEAGALVNFPTPERAAAAMARLWACHCEGSSPGNPVRHPR